MEASGAMPDNPEAGLVFMVFLPAPAGGAHRAPTRRVTAQISAVSGALASHERRAPAWRQVAPEAHSEARPCRRGSVIRLTTQRHETVVRRAYRMGLFDRSGH